MFEKNIFQVWIQGCDKVTKPEYLQNIKNWKSLNPDWKYSCLGEKELREACAKFSPECLHTFDNFDIMHLKIDFGRYVVLYLNGGIFADMDAYVVRSLDSSKDVQTVIEKSRQGLHVLGLSTVNMTAIESFLVFGYKTMINNAIMMATPHNPLIGNFIKEIIAKAKDNNKYLMESMKVNSLTGPWHVNKYFQPLVASPPSGNYIKVFDSDVFEPCKVRDCNITKNTLSIHEMEMSWLPKGFRIVHNSYYAVKNYVPLLFIIPLIYVIIRRYYCPCR